MPRVVICDASPLHYLILIGNTEVLQALYTEVLIPEAVVKELK
jgi:predicted nucleic acid-binding protein